ncbi:3-dehydroquinate synthase [candidate division KSB1 bacterium]|nr:MAG: 3-dehydroquinate synthase [candidate division KSB1 bacterium]
MSAYNLRLILPDREIPICFAAKGMEWIAEQLKEIVQRTNVKLFVITDERVALHYGEELRDTLRNSGFEVAFSAFPPGEGGKRINRVSAILDEMVESRLTRDGIVIGFGGGVVTDIAGFAASVYRRGINWIAVPTSLMGMVDAAIGGKTGVDHPLGKNLIGAFHQPLAVLAPLNALHTLDRREWLSGSAEVVKSAVLSGGELWQSVLQNGPDLFLWEREKAYETIAQAAEVKIGIVAQDEYEAGLRRVLNFGHTLGHALESATDFSTFSHGEAVFLGMRAAVRLSRSQALLAHDAAGEIEKLLAQVSFPRANVSPDVLLDALGHDKKNVASGLNWILLNDIGKPLIRTDISPDLAKDAARWLCEIVGEGREHAYDARRLRIVVINGPNLNLLGTREPNVYGTASYDELVRLISQSADELGVDVLIRQSNSEGDIVSLIQQARHWADGVVINPGGYTHTSVAIRDAISAVNLPAVEVHISDITKREEFRAVSLIRPVCMDSVIGEGLKGYRKAMELICASAKKQDK